MLTISYEGLDALQSSLAGFPANLTVALTGKAESLANALVAKIRDEKLAGEVLHSRSGALAASIAAEIVAGENSVVATVGSSGVKYAAIQEYGGRTAAHEILPSKGAVLAFLAGGALRFARKVEHPGSEIPERSYLRSSLGEMAEDIRAEFVDALEASWGTS